MDLDGREWYQHPSQNSRGNLLKWHNLGYRSLPLYHFHENPPYSMPYLPANVAAGPNLKFHPNSLRTRPIIVPLRLQQCRRLYIVVPAPTISTQRAGPPGPLNGRMTLRYGVGRLGPASSCCSCVRFTGEFSTIPFFCLFHPLFCFWILRPFRTIWCHRLLLPNPDFCEQDAIASTLPSSSFVAPFFWKQTCFASSSKRSAMMHWRESRLND